MFIKAGFSPAKNKPWEINHIDYSILYYKNGLTNE